MSRLSLSKTQIKYIALITMFIGHTSQLFLNYRSWLFSCFFEPVSQFTIICMCYMLCEGYYNTKSVLKYGLRLLVFGFLAQVPYIAFFNTDKLNVMFSLTLGLVMLYILNNIANKYLKIFVIILCLILCPVIEGSFYIPLFVIIYYVCITYEYDLRWCYIAVPTIWFLYNYFSFVKNNLFIKNLIICNILNTLVMVIGGIICVNCNNKKGKYNKVNQYLFYIIYPLHLWILWYIKNRL